MFRIDMLPAHYGDCLWIEYGDPGRPSRILIDGGTPKTFSAIRSRIDAVVEKEGSCRFELFVVTHVDQDHIGGALPLMEHRDDLKVSFDDIWFNGYRHIVQVRKHEAEKDELGVNDGETLSRILHDDKLQWNEAFGRGALVVPGDGPLPEKPLAGGMRLTLLSPTPETLLRLEATWADVVDEEERRRIEEEAAPGDELGESITIDEVVELADSDFATDRAAPNGTSIALIAEYQEKRLLLGADAFAPVLQKSLERDRGGRRIDAFKLSHHGSRANVSMELLRSMQCSRFLVSSNGVKFKHPDREAIARAIRASGPDARLYFNYETAFNEAWKSATLKNHYEYEAHYAAAGEPMRITLAE